MIATNVQPQRLVADATVVDGIAIDAPLFRILSRSQMVLVLGVRQIARSEHDARSNHVNSFGGEFPELLDARVIREDTDVDV